MIFIKYCPAFFFPAIVTLCAVWQWWCTVIHYKKIVSLYLIKFTLTVTSFHKQAYDVYKICHNLSSYANLKHISQFVIFFGLFTNTNSIIYVLPHWHINNEFSSIFVLNVRTCLHFYLSAQLCDQLLCCIFIYNIVF